MFAAGIPSVVPAQSMQHPTQSQVRTALAAANLSFQQKREIQPMVETYNTEIGNAPSQAAEHVAAQRLVSNLKSVMTPAQQSKFKQSLMSQTASH